MLFNTTADIKASLGAIHQTLSFETVASFVDQAEAKYLEPFIGRPLLDELAALTTPNAQQTELLKRLRAALANYAVLDAAPMLTAAFSDMGLTEQSAQNATPARQWVYYNYIDGLASAGDGGLERALAYLEEQAASFPTWTSSDAYAAGKELFLQSGRELARYLNVPEPRRAYLVLRPFIRRVEDLTLRPLLTDLAFDDLKARERTGNLSDEDKGLLALIRPVVAHRALAEAIPEIAVAISGGGVRMLADHDGIRGRQTASDAQLDALARRTEATALAYLERLKRYLDTNTPAETQRAAELPENSRTAGYFFV